MNFHNERGTVPFTFASIYRLHHLNPHAESCYDSVEHADAGSNDTILDLRDIRLCGLSTLRQFRLCHFCFTAGLLKNLAGIEIPCFLFKLFTLLSADSPVFPVEIGAIADIKLALKQILAAAKEIKPEGISKPELRKEIADFKANFKKQNQPICDDGRFPMTPQRILRDCKAILPEDALIFTDVGWNKNGVAQQYDITVPGAINHPSGLATMGFGAAAILGAKLAAPDRVVITLTGDGGFGAANPCVIATAKEQGIPVIWVVMNNSAFGTIAGLEGLHYKNERENCALHLGTEFKIRPAEMGDTTGGEGTFQQAWEPYSPDWAAVARGYGIKARKIASADEFAEALKEAIECNEPYLIDAPMENIAVPTPGVWNINDIYTHKDNVDIENGRLKFPDELGGKSAEVVRSQAD